MSSARRTEHRRQHARFSRGVLGLDWRKGLPRWPLATLSVEPGFVASENGRRLLALRWRLSSRIARLSDGIDQGAQPRHDGGVARQRLELGHDEREGGDESREGDRRLSDDAELDL